MPAISIVVRGRVQGVGFRVYVLQRALPMGIRGEVANHRDGSVRATAEHEDPTVLDRFVETLKDGPGRVDSVTFEPTQSGGYFGFEIGGTEY